MTSGRFIDLERWKRREHFALYRSFANPFWSLTADVDVTRAWDTAARDDRSFSLVSLHALLDAANATQAFRLRIRPDGVWCHDAVGVSTTVLRADETIGFAVLQPRESFAEFEAHGRDAIARARTSATLETPEEAADDLLYHSSLPWVRFTSFTNAIGRADADSIPRIVFGRATQDGTTRRMPVAVEVHHGVVDGLDVGRFLERFEQALARD